MLALGEETLRTGRFAPMGELFDELAPNGTMITLLPTTPAEMRLICMAAILAPYYAGGVLVEGVRHAAENAEGRGETPKDRMYLSVARGIPSVKAIEESLMLPAPYDWFAATQWGRICHLKKAVGLFEIVYPVVMAGPRAHIEADVDYEIGLAERLFESIMRRTRRSDKPADYSALLKTFPPPDTQPHLRRLRLMESRRMLGIPTWNSRLGKVK